MSEQLALVAATERDQALEQVEQNADDGWLDLALAAVKRTCEERAEWISDDIWEVADLPSTREDRALGPVIRKAARLGWCVKTDRVRPSIRSRMSGKPCWVSLIYQGDQS